jgi:hypothetical protein
MPTPLGHGLAGLAAGWAMARSPLDRRRLWIQVAWLAAIGAAADLDLIVGHHRAEGHSVGAAVIVASLAAWYRWPIASSRTGIWLAAFAAYGSHLVTDMLAFDQAPPIGIMVWWPFSSSYYQTGLSVFDSVSREWWAAYFWRHNPIAAAREVAILAPILFIVWWLRRPRDPGQDRYV